MKAFTLFTVFLISFGCSTKKPSKEKLEQFNKQVENESLKSIKDLGKSSNKKIPLKEGQWVKILTQLKSGDRIQTFATFKVLKVKGRTVTMEVETTHTSTLTPHIIQYEVENYPLVSEVDLNKPSLEKLVDKMKIKKMVMKQGDGPAQEISMAYMPMAKGLLKQLFTSGHRIGELKRLPCNSEHFKASECVVFEFEATAFGTSAKGVNYAHSSVPILGFLKSDSDQASTEVLNFGLEGAKTSL